MDRNGFKLILKNEPDMYYVSKLVSDIQAMTLI